MSRNPLFDAIEKQDENQVLCLIRERIDVDAECYSKFGSPLFCAVERNAESIASILIEAGAQVDGLVDQENAIPLHAAIINGNVRLVRLLLNHGANVSLDNHYGHGCLHLAAVGKRVEIAAILLAAGANINARDDEGWTPLFFAVYECNIDVVKLLIATPGCEINARNLSGESALTYISTFHNHAEYDVELEIAHVLVNAGAEVDARSKRSWTPLHICCKYGNVGIVRLLLVCGAPVDILSTELGRQTPIESFGVTEKIACLLFAAGAERRKSRFDPAQYRQQIALAANELKRARVDLIRWRAYEICAALQSLQLSAAETCRILEFACEPFSNCVKFHNFWDIAVCVKHFKDRQKKDDATVAD